MPCAVTTGTPAASQMRRTHLRTQSRRCSPKSFAVGDFPLGDAPADAVAGSQPPAASPAPRLRSSSRGSRAASPRRRDRERLDSRPPTHRIPITRQHRRHALERRRPARHLELPGHRAGRVAPPGSDRDAGDDRERDGSCMTVVRFVDLPEGATTVEGIVLRHDEKVYGARVCHRPGSTVPDVCWNQGLIRRVSGLFLPYLGGLLGTGSDRGSCALRTIHGGLFLDQVLDLYLADTMRARPIDRRAAPPDAIAAVRRT